MDLPDIISALSRGKHPQRFAERLTAWHGGWANGAYREKVWRVGDYVIKNVVGRTIWSGEDDGKPYRQVEVPPLPPCVHPPEQYVVGDWLVQRYYTPIYDKGEARLTPEEREHSQKFTGEPPYNLDLNYANLGRDDQGRLIAFDW